MDLIEVLWKQDVDLGFTLVEPTSPDKTLEKESDDDIEKLKALKAINATNEKVRLKFVFTSNIHFFIFIDAKTEFKIYYNQENISMRDVLFFIIKLLMTHSFLFYIYSFLMFHYLNDITIGIPSIFHIKN